MRSMRTRTSLRAWSRVLVSSAGSNSETTSNENSATGIDDRVDARVHRGGRQDNPEPRRDHEQGADPDRPFVKRLERRLVIRVGAVVEVVDALELGPLDELV